MGRIMDHPPLLLIGHNETRLWGMSADERVRRMARARTLEVVDALPESGAVLLVDLRFAFDPAWLRSTAGQPGRVVTYGGRVVLAHAVDTDQARALIAAMTSGAPVPALSGLTLIAAEGDAQLHNAELRKRETPFLLPLRPDTVPAIERASYYSAYKGVTDLLTKYLWPELAFYLTRAAAALRLTPNMVTAVGAVCCVLAFFAFLDGRYWLGLAVGFVFMVLDTVDGKLARCTITSSSIGNIFDHGIDLVHPPFWWWAWAQGLASYGRPLPPGVEGPVLGAIIGGYIVGRAIEGVFMRRFGMHIHVWRPIDSRFRLVTARRNPNVLILVGALLFGRPDVGLVLLAVWTVVSLLFHLLRWLQAEVAHALHRPIVSWLN